LLWNFSPLWLHHLKKTNTAAVPGEARKSNSSGGRDLVGPQEQLSSWIKQLMMKN
jgi:hypothetical protein